MFRSCRTVLAVLAVVFTLPAALAAPASFEAAKVLARQQVYHDRADQGTFYCGCRWEWAGRSGGLVDQDRKSTRLNSSHVRISYAVFCLKKKKKKTQL